jgi:hypothetical protein
MAPLPIEGADVDFYFRQFATHWYRGPHYLTDDLDEFARTYRVPDADRIKLRMQIRLTSALAAPEIEDALNCLPGSVTHP